MTNAFLTNTVMVLGVFAVTFAASGGLHGGCCQPDSLLNTRGSW